MISKVLFNQLNIISFLKITNINSWTSKFAVGARRFPKVFDLFPDRKFTHNFLTPTTCQCQHRKTIQDES
ncbi:hypothetical protein EYC84_002434 [Monilinia fructicola]|uniref:Uncharacterized protein n=1 Tax=Monilinia fructicola TaxID=38448 RepID=A0A5M9JQN1_MONFR|nr:hypothetical protein EYC84_002434 [Monilinia fructicola]